MKKLVLGAIFLGFASLGYSQSSHGGISLIKLSGVEVSSVNQNYLNKVVKGSNSGVVYTLENEAATYKIERLPSYDDYYIYGDMLNKTYNVQFSKHNGEILATYDRNGNIISTIERFDDLTPPPAIRNSVYKSLPDWTLKSTTYTVSYDGKDAKKMYKVQLSKDNQKKTLKFNVDERSTEEVAIK